MGNKWKRKWKFWKYTFVHSIKVWSICDPNTSKEFKKTIENINIKNRSLIGIYKLLVNIRNWSIIGIFIKSVIQIKEHHLLEHNY